MDSNQRPNLPGGQLSEGRHASDLLSHLKALKTDLSNPDTVENRSWPWRIGLAVGGVALLATLATFFCVTAWRLHGPNMLTLDDGWLRVADRHWGFEVDFPNVPSKTTDSMTSERYSSSFVNRIPIRLRVQKWPLGNNKSTPENALAAILSTERSIRPVEVLIDRSKDATSPMIDFVSTCGPPGNQWTVRERVIIHRDVMLRIDVTSAEHARQEELDRLMNSVRWLR